MPLVRIDLHQRKASDYHRKIGDMAYRAMRDTMDVPEHDWIAELLAIKPGIRPEDVLVNLVECAREDWSFGNGMASYAS